MPVIKCNGVNVEFPFDPYDCQNDYMSKVIECLQSGTNGILESPTGTGKTLCLLCATLAWRNTYISKQELGRCLQSADEEAPPSAGGTEGSFRQKLANDLKEGAGGSWGDEQQQGMFMDRPRIIYASRTHSQLSQAVDQLKDTAYRPRVAVLGSREQLCVHPEVQKAESHTAKVHMCRAKVNSRMCNFYNNLDQKKADKAFTDSILDIEDLVKLGNTHKVCPYYMAKELKTNADIIFMPYNYLLDARARRAHGVELNGNIVIFDEAHNVEKMCEESASFDLTSYDLASCVEETDHLLKKTVEVEMSNQGFRADSDADGDFDASALATLKKLFLDLETEINNMAPPKDGITKPGGFIYELFAKVHITFETKVEILQLLEKIISHLTTSSTIFHNKAAGLEKFCEIINIIFNKASPSGQVEDSGRCYKVHIHPSQQKKGGRTDLWTSKNPTKAANKQGYTLSYWCFSPGFTMKDLVAQGVRSIILTSGTLSPLNSFKSELQIDFPIQLENPHVIGKHQMTVAVMTKGPDNTVLNSSYQTRFNIDYIMSLGNAIVNFARLVPNGLLVFFPSYPVMNNSLEQWQESGIRNRISQYKEVFVEPRGKTDFVQTIEAFYEKINDPKLNGACFFAVCRGKVSEGLDFADINGRAVVITGLPYPPRMDAKIQLKMKYLDEARRRNSTALSGQEWYCQQASRAVNQAIGRVIRHKEDFGAILLCDKRFSHHDTRMQLPSWVRPYVNVYQQFGKAIRDLTTFFRETEKMMPKPKVKQARSSAPVLINQSQCHQQPISAPPLSSLAPVAKATQFDMHVPSLKRNRDGSHVSEAQLKIMYEDSRPTPAKKATGLLNALSNVETTSLDQDDGFLSQRSSQSKNEQSSLLRRLDDQKKKKKIVIKQQNGGRSVLDKKTSSEPSNSDPKKESTSRVEKFMLPAQQYIDEVKRTLSTDSYKAFTSILRSYKKNDNFLVTTSELADLFVTYDESRYHLFRNFYTFARAPHKKNFDKICTDLTGIGCGYKPEHSVPPKLKRIKELPSGNETKPSRVEVNQPINSTESAKGSLPGHTSNPNKKHKFDSMTLSNITASLNHSDEMCRVNHLQGASVTKNPQLAPEATTISHVGGSDREKHLPRPDGLQVQSKDYTSLIVKQKEEAVVSDRLELIQSSRTEKNCFKGRPQALALKSREHKPAESIHLQDTLSAHHNRSKNPVHQEEGRLEPKDQDGTNWIESVSVISPGALGILGENSNQVMRSEKADLSEKEERPEALSVDLSEPQNATIPPVFLGSQPHVEELKTTQRPEQESSSQTLNQDGVDLNGKDRQVIDEEEPMSLDSSVDDVDVLDASKDLFDDCVGQPDHLRGSVMNIESSSSKDCPSIRETNTQQEDSNPEHQKPPQDEVQVGTRNRQDSNLASSTRSKWPRVQKLALEMKRSIKETRESDSGGLKEQKDKQTVEEEDQVKEQSVNKSKHKSKRLTPKRQSDKRRMCMLSGSSKRNADELSTESASSSSEKRTGLLAEVDKRKTPKKANAPSKSFHFKQGLLVKKSEKTPEKQGSLGKLVDSTKSKKTPDKRKLTKTEDNIKSKKTPDKHGRLIKPQDSPKCLTPSKKKSKTSDGLMMKWQTSTNTPTKVSKSITPSKKKSLQSPGTAGRTPSSVSKRQATEGTPSDSRITSDKRRKETDPETPKHKHRRTDGKSGKVTRHRKDERVHSDFTKGSEDNLKENFVIVDGLLKHSCSDKKSPRKRLKTPSPKKKLKRCMQPEEDFQAGLQESKSTPSKEKKAKSTRLRALFKEQSEPQTEKKLNCNLEAP
ncbi:regulator of telomere elongation helicase 1-like [Asterias amurensis]|uniref:regulator of telomere elongation helicase 1-like n=1 Tax=Asterias amurensis TaxID=7602 RepID=UPI003AB7D1EF